MPMLSVLVTGATGQQGGALSRTLLKKGHHVRGFTRNPNSDAAQKLRSLGAELVAGNLEDCGSLERAMNGMDAVFSVSTPYETDTETETRQGVTVADAAAASGISHLIFTSVPRANEHTGIPHFDSKMRVEQHIAKLNVPHTIIGPCFFMENLLSTWWLPAMRQGKFAIAISPKTKLQMVAVEDVGSFAAHVIENRDKFLGRRIDIASDERTPLEIAHVVSRASGRKIEHEQTPIEQVRAWNEDFALMFEYFEHQGTGIDVSNLRREYPQVGWLTLEQWAAKQSWDAVKQSAA